MMAVGCEAASKGEIENVLGIKNVNFNYLVVGEMIITLLKTRTFAFANMSTRVPFHYISGCQLIVQD